MDEFERRLRTALRSVSERPPPGLLGAVRQRHARHVRRVGAGWVAAVAAVAVAVPPVTHALRPGGGPRGAGGSAPVTAGGSAPPGPPSTSPGMTVTIAPGWPAGPEGTVVRGCTSANGAQTGANWRSASLVAGPVWFVYAGLPGTWPVSGTLPDGKRTAEAGTIAIRPGASAIIAVAPSARGRFRFLPGYGSLNKFTLRDGRPGLTLVGCPPRAGRAVGRARRSAPTMFWVAYVSDRHGCIPLDVYPRANGRPIRVNLPLSSRSCPHH
jgi:hypothetical protein